MADSISLRDVPVCCGLVAEKGPETARIGLVGKTKYGILTKGSGAGDMSDAGKHI